MRPNHEDNFVQRKLKRVALYELRDAIRFVRGQPVACVPRYQTRRPS